MDSRIHEHAKIITDHSVRIESGDMVHILAPTCAEDLVVALYERLGEIDARPKLSWLNRRAERVYLRNVTPEEYVTAEHSLAMMEKSDVHIYVRGDENSAEFSDTPSGTRQAASRASEPIQGAFPERTVVTQYPAPGTAQKAEMSTEAYEDFVWNVINRDWDRQRRHQQQLVELLDPAEEVRIVSGDETDIEMSVAGMDARNDDGRKNLPGGEVYTVPVPESVEGTIRFDIPLFYSGTEIEEAYLEFEDGTVTYHTAVKNEDTLASVLDTDAGARRLGELGIGMNRDVDRFTKNTLFDEKMGDTVHVALGSSIGGCVPDGMEANESSIHLDMIVDMSTDSFIEIDGEVVQRNGRFVFEKQLAD